MLVNRTCCFVVICCTLWLVDSCGMAEWLIDCCHVCSLVVNPARLFTLQEVCAVGPREGINFMLWVYVAILSAWWNCRFCIRNGIWPAKNPNDHCLGQLYGMQAVTVGNWRVKREVITAVLYVCCYMKHRFMFRALGTVFTKNITFCFPTL